VARPKIRARLTRQHNLEEVRLAPDSGSYYLKPRSERKPTSQNLKPCNQPKLFEAFEPSTRVQEPEMLPRIRIIQIGDIHLPSAASGVSHVDSKDARFPVELKNVISAHPIKSVFREIYRLLERGGISAALFMGDLTDIGDLKGYQACVQYIARSLQLGMGGVFANFPVGILPGNHDIDRMLAKRPGLTTKFDPLVASLATAGLMNFPVRKPVWLKVQSGAAKTKIALLNSCWGCGANEFIPEEFREAVTSAIDSALAGGKSERAVRAYYDRQFDTPAFSEQSIHELASSSETLGGELLVVCAHHNLLPQRLPRLAPYTELVNSGALRATFAELRRPIVYLHGHIHEDPIEIVQVPGGDPLVCVSAPEASAGFNILEFVSTQQGLPLSCHITQWRFNNGGFIRPKKPITISLVGNRRRSASAALAQVYSSLLKTGDVYWADVLDIGKDIFSNDVEEQLAEALELLAADGRVTIENYDLDRKSWIVGAKI
jgi:hypothetical protein